MGTVVFKNILKKISQADMFKAKRLVQGRIYSEFEDVDFTFLEIIKEFMG